MTSTPPAYPSQPQQPYAQQQPALPHAQQPTQPQQQYGGRQAPVAPAYQGQVAGYAPVKPLPTNTTVKDTNTYALVSVILTFIVPLAGIIIGHMALAQIKRTGDAGRGLALTAVIYGYACFVSVALFLIFYIGFIIWAVGMAMSASTGGGYYS